VHYFNTTLKAIFDLVVFRLQAKSIAEPFAFEEYRKKKILEKIEEERENRVRIKVCCQTNCI